MAEGVRIRHDSKRNCVLTVVSSRAYREPVQCPTCLKTHTQKTYHIRLDDQGTGIVSPEVWNKLRRAKGAGFSQVDTVASPPAQGVAVRSTMSFFGAEMVEMPSGVRVTHPSLRGERLVLVDAEQPYGVPYACAICGLVHTHKTYHLDLDADGGTLVSTEVAKTLERLGMSQQEIPAGPPVVAAIQS
jgi:hypothetical protein